MKIHFDYKDVSPDDIQEVVQFFYEKYKNDLGTDGKQVEMGKVNVYISIQNQTDSTPLDVVSNGKIISWIVKKQPLQKTNKELIGKLEDSESQENQLFVYKSIENSNKRW